MSFRAFVVAPGAMFPIQTLTGTSMVGRKVTVWTSVDSFVHVVTVSINIAWFSENIAISDRQISEDRRFPRCVVLEARNTHTLPSRPSRHFAAPALARAV